MLQSSMMNKMKVINMELFNQNNLSIIEDVYDKSNCLFQQIAVRFLQVLREDSGHKLENIKELITAETLPFLTRVINYFLKSSHRLVEQDQERCKNLHQTQKALKDSIQKASRRLSQAMTYIEHIKSKLTHKENQLVKKDQAIMILKKQCQIWKEKSKKSNILRELSESSLLLKNLQVTINSYPKPEEIEVSYQPLLNKQNENVFYRTAYENSRKNQQKLKRRKICTSSNEHKLKKRQQRRQFRKSFDPLKPKNDTTNTFRQKESQLMNNGLLIAQKQLSQQQNKKSTSQR